MAVGSIVNIRRVPDSSGDPLFYILDTGVVFNGVDNSWVREGQTIQSKFFAIKPDAARWNSGVQALFSDDPLRATDFSLLRAHGTVDSPASVGATTVLTNIRAEAHDGTDFFVASLLRAQVDGTPAENDVRAQWRFVMWDGSTNGTGLVIRSTRKVGVNMTNPTSFFEVNGSRGLKVDTLNAATLTLDETHHLIRVTYTATGSVAITLPSAASSWNSSDGVGREYIIKDAACMAATNNIVVSADGSDTIATTSASSTSVTMNGNGDTARFVATSSTEWSLI